MQRRLVRQALDQLPAEIARPAAAETARAAAARCRGARRSRQRTSRRTMPSVDGAQRLSHAGAAPADLRGVLPVPDRPCLAAPRDQRASSSRSCRWSTIAFAQSAAKVLPFKLTPGQRQAVKEIVDDMLLAAADAPAAAGRRRRRQDDRGAAGGDRGDGERPAGGVHGADRDPGRRSTTATSRGCCRSRASASTC